MPWLNTVQGGGFPIIDENNLLLGQQKNYFVKKIKFLLWVVDGKNWAEKRGLYLISYIYRINQFISGVL